MIDFLIYDAKVAVLIAAFYMFYRLLLARETFHRVNRIVLLLTAVASFVLPLCVITMHETVVVAQPTVTIGDMQMAVVDEDMVSTPWWQMALPFLFIIGMLATLGHTLWSLFRIIKLIRSSEQHPQPDGTTICVTGHADSRTIGLRMLFAATNKCDDSDERPKSVSQRSRHAYYK